MHIDFKGRPVDEPRIRAGFIGCGSHSFRNLYPTFQFTPVNLVAVCDLDRRKAEAFAARFGAKSAYCTHHEMLAGEDLDAVFICTGYDEKGRPLYPDLSIDCLRAGCHVWIEKPPAASCDDILRMQTAARQARKHVVVGMKKMFFPANVKAKELMSSQTFDAPQLVTLRYPQYVPSREEFDDYVQHGKPNAVVTFLDHLCHPTSLLIYLLGMPESLHFERSGKGAGLATFRYASGAIASIVLSHGASLNGGMERTVIVSDSGQHITIENNTRVTLHRDAIRGYGDIPDFYAATPDRGSIVWEPEFSLGQLYNKGRFLLGYFNEIDEFVRAILQERPPSKGTLEQAWQVTRIFEAFAEGPGRQIAL